MEVTLVVVGGKQDGRKILATGPKYVIGRSQDCNLRLQSGMISRKHCVLTVHDHVVTIEDCGSTNGTSVNGERIEKPQELKTGDRIQIASLELEVRLTHALVASSPQKPPSATSAAAATPAKPVVAKTSAEDIDLSDWLAEDEEKPAAPPPTNRSSTDTHGGRTMIDTVNIPAQGVVQPMKDAPTQEMRSAVKEPEAPRTSGKPAASSQAAKDMLRRIISKPKS